jgi:hypothetical protein
MRKLLYIGLAALAGLLMNAPAQARSHGGIYANLSAQTGYELQPLMHDQLAPMDANRNAVVALAQKYLPYDGMANTLISYIGKQREACAYGLAGGFIPVGLAASEYSPLHLCTHAFLAGTQALLQQLNSKAPADEVKTLYGKVFAEGGIIGCAYSAKTFNTDDIVHVDLPDIPRLPNSLAIGGGLFVGLLLFYRSRRRWQRT